MTKRCRASWRPLALAIVALLLVSCRPSPPLVSPVPTPTPTPASAPPAATPIPLAKPQAVEADRALVVEFTKAQAALERDWEKFRQTYEELRQKDLWGPKVMTDSLNGFVARFQQVKGSIAQLPGSPPVESVAEGMIQAAEKEETALKSLRASWKPGGESAFEKYEGERRGVDKMRRDAASKLQELITASLPENVEAATQYAKTQRPIDQDWDALHKRYDDWHKSEPEKEDIPATLQGFVADFQAILNRIYDLPRPSPVKKWADLLVEAGEKEEAALRQLRDTWKPSDSGFQTYEQQRLTVNKLRRDSRLGVEEAIMAGRNRAVLEEFSSLYRAASKSWDEFQTSYETWRNRGGDSSRKEVAEYLTGLVTSFHGLASRVYGLPRPTPIRPLTELLIQAAEKEEEALRQLRDTWEPYDPRYFRAYEGRWVEIDRLRRQAAAGVSELVRKYNITAAELER